MRWRDPVALHAVLDQLFDELRSWARLLADQDRALGVSPLASMPTAAGRTPSHIRSLALVMAALESSWRGGGFGPSGDLWARRAANDSSEPTAPA